jgi:hypothetical protein
MVIYWLARKRFLRFTMGDSSVSCAFSGLTLHNEPVAFLPLIKSRYSERLTGAKLIAHGSQACAIFSPMTLPIFGKTDCYGRMQEIEEDANTRAIEAWVGMPIAKFIEYCIEGTELPNVQQQFEPIIPAGCFISKEIYDRFSQPIIGGKCKGSLWRSTFAGSPHLEAVGCVLDRDINEEVWSACPRLTIPAPGSLVRYNFIYHHPSIPGVEFRSDGDSVKAFDKNGEELKGSGYGLDDLHKTLIQLGFSGFPKEDIEKAKKSSEIQALLAADLLEYQRSAKMHLSTEHKELIVQQSISGCVYLRSLLENHALFGDYLSIMNSGDGDRQFFLKRMEEVFYLLWSFSCANRLLMPTICGTQYPENDITQLIASFIADVAGQRNRRSNN